MNMIQNCKEECMSSQPLGDIFLVYFIPQFFLTYRNKFHNVADV